MAGSSQDDRIRCPSRTSRWLETFPLSKLFARSKAVVRTSPPSQPHTDTYPTEDEPQLPDPRQNRVYQNSKSELPRPDVVGNASSSGGFFDHVVSAASAGTSFQMRVNSLFEGSQHRIKWSPGDRQSSQSTTNSPLVERIWRSLSDALEWCDIFGRAGKYFRSRDSVTESFAGRSTREADLARKSAEQKAAHADPLRASKDSAAKNGDAEQYTRSPGNPSSSAGLSESKNLDDDDDVPADSDTKNLKPDEKNPKCKY